MAKCRGNVGLAELPQRHSPGRQERNRVDDVDGPACLAVVEWHQQVRGLVASRYGWRW